MCVSRTLLIHFVVLLTRITHFPFIHIDTFMNELRVHGIFVLFLPLVTLCDKVFGDKTDNVGVQIMTKNDFNLVHTR